MMNQTRPGALPRLPLPAATAAQPLQRQPFVFPPPPRAPRQPVLAAPARTLQARAAAGQLRLYPNLRPLARQPDTREQIFTLQQWYGSYGMRGEGGRGHYVPNARYLFVRTTDGQTKMHPRLRHPVLSGGEPVMYAGEACFEGGALRWWSNGSGHYRPDPEHATQAGLPMTLFRTWDDVVRRGSRAPPRGD